MQNAEQKIEPRYLRLLRGSLFAEFGVEGDEGGDEEAGDGGEHDPDEEMLVTDNILKPAAEHAGKHHAEGHETGANGVVGGLVLAAGDVDHIEHVGGEPEAVTELLDGDAEVDDKEVTRLRIGEINKDGVGQMHDEHHGPEPGF